MSGRRVDHHVLVVADKCPSPPPPSPLPSLCGCSCLSPSIDLRLARHNVYGPETMMITNIHHLLTARDINLIWLDIGRNKPIYSSCGTSRLIRRGARIQFPNWPGQELPSSLPLLPLPHILSRRIRTFSDGYRDFAAASAEEPGNAFRKRLDRPHPGVGVRVVKNKTMKEQPNALSSVFIVNSITDFTFRCEKHHH